MCDVTGTVLVGRRFSGQDVWGGFSATPLSGAIPEEPGGSVEGEGWCPEHSSADLCDPSGKQLWKCLSPEGEGRRLWFSLTITSVGADSVQQQCCAWLQAGLSAWLWLAGCKRIPGLQSI